MAELLYRTCTRSEFDLAVQWAAVEGWNPGQGDDDIYWETDPEGFVCIERDGEMIGSGSIVSYNGPFGFMGFYIVRSDLRGQGIGGPFWTWRKELLTQRLQPDAAIGMDGVFAMEAFYARGGFRTSHRNLRMTGTAQAAPRHSNTVDWRDVPFAHIAAVDQRCFGFARERFLRRWLNRPNGTSLAYVNDGQLQGFGTIRPAQTGFRIGPLFADTPAVAESLYAALADTVAGQTVFLDAPENNPAAMALVRRHSLTEVFGCARMYAGSFPPLPWGQIYGVTSFELG